MSQIHQEVSFEGPAAKIYKALTESAEFTKVTGAPSEIGAQEGGTLSLFGGYVQGRQISLVPNKRVVQVWRGADWPEGVFSIARFELTAEGDKTRLVFDQDGAPATAVAHLEKGWNDMYWEPIRKYLGA